MLSDILQHTAEVVGIQPTDDNKRSQLLRYINRAAREIYYTNDLPNSVDQRVFSIDNLSLQEVVLPWYVKDVRAARYAEYGSKIELHTIQRRFHHFPWKPPFLAWRVMRNTPLEQSIAQASQLQFTIAQAEASPISITVVGQTTNAARTTETVVIDVGETTATTVNQWMQEAPFGIEAIQKDRVTDSDVVVTTTVDNEPVARIPNRLLEAFNQRLRLTEDDINAATEQGVEILFKIRMIPLLLNSDVFISSDFDDAVVWKVREHWYSTKDDEASIAKVGFASNKCAKLLRELCYNEESGKSIVIDAAPSPYFNSAKDYAKVP